jgi:hypothetical protein
VPEHAIAVHSVLQLAADHARTVKSANFANTPRPTICDLRAQFFVIPSDQQPNNERSRPEVRQNLKLKPAHRVRPPS